MDRALAVFSAAIRRADPMLDLGVDTLATKWSNGVMFYLREPVAMRPRLDGVRRLAVGDRRLGQAQFWAGHDFARDFGDGTVKDCLSAAISEFDAPGIVFGKPARRCIPLRDHHGDLRADERRTSATPAGSRSRVTTWWPPHVDRRPAVRRRGGGRGQRRHARPEPRRLPRATPDRRGPRSPISRWPATGSAPTSRRRPRGRQRVGPQACNAILEASGSRATPAKIFTPYKPPQYAAARAADEVAYRAGRPNLLDVPVHL